MKIRNNNFISKYKMSLKYNFDPYENSSLIMCIILYVVMKKLAVYLNSLDCNYYIIKPFLDSQNIKYEIKIHNQSKL